LALVSGLFGTTLGFVRAERERQVAEAAEENERQQRQRAEFNEKRAREERDRALEAEADTGAFHDFLVNQVVAARRPRGVRGGTGVDVKMTEALEIAEKKMDEVFRGRPKAEAPARHALGVTWRNFGKYEAAERHLRRALELLIVHFGPNADVT